MTPGVLRNERFLLSEKRNITAYSNFFFFSDTAFDSLEEGVRKLATGAARKARVQV